MRTCAGICVGISAFAIFLLPIWMFMLFNHSSSFELPATRKTPAAQSCLVSIILYVISGVVSVMYLIKTQKKKVQEEPLHRHHFRSMSSHTDSTMLQPLLSHPA